MGGGKTIPAVAAIILSTLTAWILCYLGISSGFVDLLIGVDRSVQILILLASVLILASAFCVPACLMLVWDAGDRIPPAVMLLLGLFGVSAFLVVLPNPASFSGTPWQVVLLSSASHLINGLNIAFGAAGLLTRRPVKAGGASPSAERGPAGGSMRTRKTVTVISGIIFSAAFIYLATRSCGLPMMKCELFFTHRVYAPYQAEAAIGFALAAVLAVICWLMLVWDAGDRIPPAVMAALGLLVIILFLIDRISPIGSTYFFSRIFYSPTALVYGGLYAAFGLAGLLRRPKGA